YLLVACLTVMGVILIPLTMVVASGEPPSYTEASFLTFLTVACWIGAITFLPWKIKRKRPNPLPTEGEVHEKSSIQGSPSTSVATIKGTRWLQYAVAVAVQIGAAFSILYLAMVSGLCENECERSKWEHQANLITPVMFCATVLALWPAYLLVRRPPPAGYAGTRTAIVLGIMATVFQVLPAVLMAAAYVLPSEWTSM
ncbi:MAG: hypothetical protein JHC87_10100, partial [Thermoleophilaceae bacterium]|nr:hypothetical protein [Thermoleophilaceae bacterium]